MLSERIKNSKYFFERMNEIGNAVGFVYSEKGARLNKELLSKIIELRIDNNGWKTYKEISEILDIGCNLVSGYLNPNYRERYTEYHREYRRKRMMLPMIIDAWREEDELLTKEEIEQRLGHSRNLKKLVKCGFIIKKEKDGVEFYKPLFYSVCDGIYERKFKELTKS